jgi:hypothetical protein
VTSVNARLPVLAEGSCSLDHARPRHHVLGSSYSQEPARRARRLLHGREAVPYKSIETHVILTDVATIDERDYQIIVLIAKFKQLTAAHINELLFNDTKTHLPCHRALHRLMDMGYLRRIEFRIVGGSRGGSGRYVYIIGREASRLMAAKYSPTTSIDYHALAIADTYRELVRLERAGRFTIAHYDTEPSCHQTIQGHELKPDMFVSLSKPNVPVLNAWLEVDRGTEYSNQIKSKLVRYLKASEVATTDDVDMWPRIYWIALNNERRNTLAKIIRQGKPEQQDLFRVITMAEVSTTFG